MGRSRGSEGDLGIWGRGGVPLEALRLLIDTPVWGMLADVSLFDA